MGKPHPVQVYAALAREAFCGLGTAPHEAEPETFEITASERGTPTAIMAAISRARVCAVATAGASASWPIRCSAFIDECVA